MEWDSGRGEHAMVLSTSSHRNFVLFEQSDDQYTFHFNTCAASISLRGKFGYSDDVGNLSDIKTCYPFLIKIFRLRQA